MTPEERIEFEKLQELVKSIEEVTNDNFFSAIEEETYKRVIDYDSGKTSPDSFVELRYKGKVYKLWATKNY
jgi:hypothetical protein